MNLLDNHVHTTFSSDGKNTMEDVIKRAIEIGVSYLIFTDHMEYHDKHFSIDFEKYCKAIENFKNKYKNEINIYTGIEIGYQKHIKDEIDSIISKYPFDFVLCSTHTVDEIDVPNPAFFEGYTREEAYRRYFTSLLETVSNFKNFDVYGHLDYVIRYNMGAMHPNKSILKRYKELGGEIITVGSDSHKALDLCKDFSKAYDLLQYLDYRYICMFNERTPVFMSIEKARRGFIVA